MQYASHRYRQGAGEACRQGRCAHQHRDQLLHREDAEGLLVGDGQQLVELTQRLQLRVLIVVLAQLHQEPLHSIPWLSTVSDCITNRDAITSAQLSRTDRCLVSAGMLKDLCQ
jgi:hypothetical protein